MSPNYYGVEAVQLPVNDLTGEARKSQALENKMSCEAFSEAKRLMNLKKTRDYKTMAEAERVRDVILKTHPDLKIRAYKYGYLSLF